MSRRALIVLLLLASCATAETREVSMVQLETPTAMPTTAPVPVVIEPDPPVPVPTHTPTWDQVWEQQGVDVTAAKTIKRCLRYRVLVDRWNPEFNLDPALVFAVMAQESACLPYEGGASVGLMQVTPAGWTTTRERLLDPATNIYWGMRILWLTLHDEENNPDHDLRTALAAYNCGWVSLKAGKCFDFGGYAYADRVLDFWLPYVTEAMQ